MKRLEGRAPIPSVSYDLARLGYEQDEFVFDGSAVSYDGGEPADYTTRFVVRRPTDSATFSGTVVVEWLNITGGLDFAPDWNMVHREILRAGHAWAGVSAQKSGIEGGGLFETMPLKKVAPERYADLRHPGDAWAFDIFSQVGACLRGEDAGEALPGLRPRQLLAIGESQSAMFLATYVNVVDEIAQVYDGFLVHSTGPAGASLSGTPPFLDGLGRVERIRDDGRVPVIMVQTETDVVVFGSARAEQPDGPTLRLWEVAGTAHADQYLVGAAEKDDGSLPAAELAAALRPTTEMLWGTMATPANAAPQHHYVAQAALRALDRWAAGGPAPASADRLLLSADGTGLELDELGVARGGVRTPWVDVPVAAFSGMSDSGDVVSGFFGSTTPFDEVTLKELYPGGRDDYVARFTNSLDDAIAAGFILDADREEIAALAAASWDLSYS